MDKKDEKILGGLGLTKDDLYEEDKNPQSVQPVQPQINKNNFQAQKAKQDAIRRQKVNAELDAMEKEANKMKQPIEEKREKGSHFTKEEDEFGTPTHLSSSDLAKAFDYFLVKYKGVDPKEAEEHSTADKYNKDWEEFENFYLHNKDFLKQFRERNMKKEETQEEKLNRELNEAISLSKQAKTPEEKAKLEQQVAQAQKKLDDYYEEEDAGEELEIKTEDW